MNPDELAQEQTTPEEGELAAMYYERNPARSKCVFCDYNVSGFEIGEICPECGETIHTLSKPNAVPKTATASVWCGSISIACLFVGLCGAFYGMLPLILATLLVAWIGAICSIRGSRVASKARHLYGRRSRVIARIGFWLCMPGVGLTVVLTAAMIYAYL